MKNILISLSIVSLLGCQNIQKQNPLTSSSKRLVSEFSSQIENDIIDDNINGSVSFIIIKGDSSIENKTFGLSTSNDGILADSNTIYRIGSITKSLTGFLLVKLHQDKILNLDDPIEKHLPEIKTLIDYDNYSPITYRQLASHTAGLHRESRYREANFGTVHEWQQVVLKAIPETSFRFSPNERFGYSNIGYAILGLAMSKAANKSYMELIDQNILQPLEMINTYFAIPENKKLNLANGMAGGPTAELDYELPLREHEGRGYRIPNGGLYSTPNDLAKFMKACMGYSNILDKENVVFLQTSQTPSQRLRSNYSFGFDIYADQGINTVGHGGSTPGYSAHFEYEKESQYGVIIMRNYNFGNTNFDLRVNSLLRKLTLLN